MVKKKIKVDLNSKFPPQLQYADDNGVFIYLKIVKKGLVEKHVLGPFEKVKVSLLNSSQVEKDENTPF